ncbi:hypothetical protein G6O69_11590 [Pseudenhygromyxa sp. WMMC2535]|uniref:hypothetical protein n=1 Tax=Pseudenhygromyxa sp. WMMC2535 TaxID=2712867 RepID=UPI001556A832|nr:hypothetical protein [Pseudenhygromyxa sp. WMMC2535]NVB38476.1 hypothetical protein [Pseudenhygromyxa sp. WMMC2535]
MPMLADIDDPRPSRVRGFAIGALIALPAGALFWWFAVAVLPRVILDNAVEFDSRLRQEDAYMQSLCANLSEETMDRDEQLCECALAVEYPSLDCRMPFMHWSLEQMVGACTDTATFESARAFCSCVRSLDEQLGEVASDSKEARQIIQRYGACTALDDALFLPPVDALIDAGESPS